MSVLNAVFSNFDIYRFHALLLMFIITAFFFEAYAWNLMLYNSSTHAVLAQGQSIKIIVFTHKVRNSLDRIISFNFQKLQCFCQHLLAPAATSTRPVTFVAT